MIRIGVVGTGGMANAHANAFGKIPGCKLVAACDVDIAKAREYAAKHSIGKVYSSIDEMFENCDVDAVTNVTPDAFHAPVSLRALAAGKHVLCEKPLATNYADARKMAAAARKAGVINMVNFSYRNSAAVHKARQIVDAGDLGRIVHVEASYLQCWLATKAWGDWRTSPALLWRLSEGRGSKGVLGDIGVHIVDFATYPTHPVKRVSCRLKVFSEIKGKKFRGYTLDANDTAIITAELQGGALASITTTRWATGQANTVELRIYGERGAIKIDLDESYTQLHVCRGRDADRNVWKTVKCAPTPNIYQRFIKSIKTGVNDQPDFERGAQVQKVLDACFLSDERGVAVDVENGLLKIRKMFQILPMWVY